MKRRLALKQLTAASLLAMCGVMPQAFAQETIKVGILHSLSGTMAILKRHSRTLR